jgi:transposase
VVSTRTQTVNRLPVLLTQLLLGGAPRQLNADTAARRLRTVRPRATGPRTLRRLAAELISHRPRARELLAEDRSQGD